MKLLLLFKTTHRRRTGRRGRGRGRPDNHSSSSCSSSTRESHHNTVVVVVVVVVVASSSLCLKCVPQQVKIICVETCVLNSLSVCDSVCRRSGVKMKKLFLCSFNPSSRSKKGERNELVLLPSSRFHPPPAFSFFSFFFKRGQKKIHLPATFRKQNLLFFVPRISFFRRLHTRPSDALLRYSIVDVLNNTNKKKKESKKGPRKRERERVWENRTSSIVIIVIPFHHHARRRKSIYLNLR